MGKHKKKLPAEGKAVTPTQPLVEAPATNVDGFVQNLADYSGKPFEFWSAIVAAGWEADSSNAYELVPVIRPLTCPNCGRSFEAQAFERDKENPNGNEE